MRPDKKSTADRDLHTISGFEAVYNEFAPKLYGLCLSGTKNPVMAEDILQEVFRKVWEHRYRIDTALPLENYLVKLAKHEMIDHFRKDRTENTKKAGLRPMTTMARTPEDMAIFNEQKSQALSLFKKMPHHTKRIFLLSRKYGKTNKEIARELALTEKAVEYHITKVLRRFRAAIDLSRG